MKELSINENDKVPLICKIVLAGIIASSIGLASTHTNIVNADATTTATVTDPSTNSEVQTDYNYPYVGLPSWQEIDEETELAQQYDKALEAENENLAEVEAGEAPTNYSPITLSEPTTPAPATTEESVLQPGDQNELINGYWYIVTPSGQQYRQAASLPTWGLFDTEKEEITDDQNAIAQDKAEEAAYEQSSGAQATNTAYTSGSTTQASYSPTSQSTAPSQLSTNSTAPAQTTSSGATNANQATGSTANTGASSSATSPSVATTQSSTLPDSSSSAYPMTKFPQTGNKLSHGLTVLGIILAAIASRLTYVKVTGKKIFENLHNLFTFSK